MAILVVFFLFFFSLFFSTTQDMSDPMSQIAASELIGTGCKYCKVLLGINCRCCFCCCCFVMVHSYGHVWAIILPNHTIPGQA